MKKTAVKVVSGALILCMLLWHANHVLAVKYDDGIYSVTNFYELEKNTVDVLVLGSSHAYMSFNTGVLWREHGISSYLLTASAQPLWNTYYYLKEALKTQKPKLIVLEGYRLLEEEEFLDAGYVIKSTYGLKWSKNRLDAIRASAPQEDWPGYLLGYTQYHDRYQELSEEDFTSGKEAEKYETWKGFELWIDYGTDMFNTSHLNGRGSCKFTSYWGEYIAGQYDMPDHRGDPAYDSWERNAVYLDALMEDISLRETADAAQIPDCLVRDNYEIFVSADGYCQTEAEAVKGVLEKLGISDTDGGGLWYFTGGENLAWSSGSGEASRYFETNRHDFGLERVQTGDGGYDNAIVIDNQRYRTVENGLNVVVFDSVTGMVADSFGMDADNEYRLCRDCN